MTALAALLGPLVAALFRELLVFLASRKDLRDVVEAKLQARQDRRTIEARAWLARALAAPRPGVGLRVQPDAPPVPPPPADDAPPGVRGGR